MEQVQARNSTTIDNKDSNRGRNWTTTEHDLYVDILCDPYHDFATILEKKSCNSQIFTDIRHSIGPPPEAAISFEQKGDRFL